MTEVKTGMHEALLHLEAADALIRKSLTWIRQQCVGSKGVSNENSINIKWPASTSPGVPPNRPRPFRGRICRQSGLEPERRW
jgi:hypothetical protein